MSGVDTGTRRGRAPTDAILKASTRERLLAAGLDLSGGEREARVRGQVVAILSDTAPLLDPAHRTRLVDELVADTIGLGPLEPLLADPEVTEVLVNGPGRAFVERAGRLRPVPFDLDAAGILRLAERVIAPLGLRLDRTAPIVDARLPDGSRVHAVIPPLAIDGPCLSIRRFSPSPILLEGFACGAPAGFLVDAVSRGWNLVVAGGTSAGKTTLLNALAASIDPAERIVTIEETAELQLRHPHLVRLEARPPNAEGAGAVAVRDLVRAALRMRPDRIIVGEVRGGEALDMLQALNTGHDGSLTTVHANDVRAALARLETLALLSGVPVPLEAIRAQIATTIDAVVFVARRADGRRRITEIAEVAAHRDGRLPDVRPLFATTAEGLAPAAEPRRPARRDPGRGAR